MIKQVGEIITSLEELPQTVEVRGAINAALKLRGALSQVNFPDKEVDVKEVNVEGAKIISSEIITEPGKDLKKDLQLNGQEIPNGSGQGLAEEPESDKGVVKQLNNIVEGKE